MKCDKCSNPLLKNKKANNNLTINVQDYKDSTNNGRIYLCGDCRRLFLDFTGLEKSPPHPMQPLVWKRENDGDIIRFKENAIVRYLLDQGIFSLNHLAICGFSEEDHEHFAQLTGYSVSGFSGLSYASDKVVEKADKQAEQMRKDREEK